MHDLNKFAVVVNNYVTGFIDEVDQPFGPDTQVLPVIADPLPTITENEVHWGPNYEVLPDRVRAYWTVAQKSPEELLQLRLAKLETLIAQLEART